MKTFKQFIEESTRKKGERYDSRMNFDADSKHSEIEVKKHDEYTTHIHHKPSGITYKIGHYSKNYSPDKADSKIHDNKPHHSISWDHNHGNELSSDKKRRIARDAQNVFHKHVKHRIPAGHVVQNTPQKNYRIQDGEVKETNTRARIYQRHGFGAVGDGRSTQYSAKIGNKLHPVDNTGKRNSEDSKPTQSKPKAK